MDKSKISQILKLILIALLLIIAPLIPTTLRFTYLYFLFNLLIVALSAESGVISFFSKPTEDEKHANIKDKTKQDNPIDDTTLVKKDETKPIEKCSSEKIVGALKVSELKKCPSTPSIFFIGNVENGKEEHIDDYTNEEMEEYEVISEEELFAKAETFIGNFYKQLKMQREDSWNKIHGFYQKAL